MQCYFATASCTGSERIVSRRYDFHDQVSHIYNGSTQGLQGRSVMLEGFPTCIFLQSLVFTCLYLAPHLGNPKIHKVLRWFRSAVMMLSAWASDCDVVRIALTGKTGEEGRPASTGDDRRLFLEVSAFLTSNDGFANQAPARDLLRHV